MPQPNISSLVPSNIANNLSQIKNPKSFGAQLVDNNKDKIIQSALGPVNKLKNDIEKIVLKRIEIETKHIQKLYDLSIQSAPSVRYDFGRKIETPPLLSEIEYQDALTKENNNYVSSSKINDKNLQDLEARLQKLISDPFADIKKNYINFKGKLASRKSFRESLKTLYQAEKTQNLIRNLYKGLVQITATLLTQQLVKVIANSADLQNLVDKTNDIIDAAETIDQLNQARVARNGCISTINNQENKIKAILSILNTLNVILTIFGILTAILDKVPVASPLGVLSKPVTILWAKAADIRDGIGITVSILIPMLNSAIFILEDLKRQLHEINQRIEDKTLLLLTDDELIGYLDGIKNLSQDPLCNTNQLPGESDTDYYDRLRTNPCIQDLLAKEAPQANPLDLSNASILTLAQQITPPSSNNLGTYKGFTFILKEENDPNFVVRGFKRHYAVAINTKSVEQVKSDYSFTLDPQQLVAQLKFIIDQQNLQG
jgi:hypothetical protein